MKRLRFLRYFWFVLLINVAESSVIQKIVVVGNIRIETETILFEVPYKKGDVYDSNATNVILKALSRTGYFKNITVDISSGVLTISVQENPVINKIAYEGMKHSMHDILKDVVKLKPRQVLSDATIQETQQIILDMYRSQGFFNAQVVPKIVRLPDNRVDLVFEIKDGKPAYVKKIMFVGNDSFLSSELRDLLSIQEKKWFHFRRFGGVTNKMYDPDKFLQDQKELTRFYLSKGYADFEIVSATAELSLDKRGFYITYNIKEGSIYKFGKVSVDSKISAIDKKLLEAAVIAKQGAVFDNQMIEFCCEILRSIAISQGYNFANIRPIFQKNRGENTVDVTFVIVDGAKVFVEKINIIGNSYTRDYVIRREIPFDEGDPFDPKVFKSAEDRIKSLNFFKNVTINASEGSDKNKVIVAVDVKEQSTGEIWAQVGYSSLERASIGLHLYNPNFTGRGQAFGFDYTFAKKESNFTIDFAEPRLFGRNIMGHSSFFYTRSKKLTGLLLTQVGGLAGLAYQIKPFVFQNISYKLHREDLSVDADKEKNIFKNLERDIMSQNKSEYAQWLETKEGGDFKRLISAEDDIGVAWGSAIIHTIAYDKRNRRILPSKGFRLSWTTKLSGLGGSIKHLINTWSGSWHCKVSKDVIFNLRGSFAHAMGLGSKIRVADALYIGGDSLRGFEFFGVSPVRGLPAKQIEEAFDGFMRADKSFLTDEQKTFLTAEEKAIKDFTLEKSFDLKHDSKKLTQWRDIFVKAVKENQSDAVKIVALRRIKGRRVGATLALYGSAELSFPMPLFPKDAEFFGTVFLDAGAAWRGPKKESGEEIAILHDDYEVRVAAGFSVAWNSPFGMLSIGYAWPLKKTDYDVVQKFLFGYGMKFN
ncbi:MAG: outer membrane protein assembly factor BamA [Holosporales bacterium]|jgi:outer membrane protein insertion porin family|nr:outer membrane protein assembly factor BamA [Holosporales bacterium]